MLHVADRHNATLASAHTSRRLFRHETSRITGLYSYKQSLGFLCIVSRVWCSLFPQGNAFIFFSHTHEKHLFSSRLSDCSTQSSRSTLTQYSARTSTSVKTPLSTQACIHTNSRWRCFVPLCESVVLTLFVFVQKTFFLQQYACHFFSPTRSKAKVLLTSVYVCDTMFHVLAEYNARISTNLKEAHESSRNTGLY